MKTAQRTAAEPTAAELTAAELTKRLNLEPHNADHAPYTWSSSALDWPTVCLDDFSGIPFLDGIPGVTAYQARACIRARDGDLVVTGQPLSPGYASYCSDHLRLGHPTCIATDQDESDIALARGCLTPKTFATLCDFAQRAGRLAIHPYMGIEAVWTLAAKIHQATKVPVRVLAPPAAVTWLANDKARLSALVTARLGPTFLVDTRAADTPAQMAEHLHAIARTGCARVGLKRTRCASAMGNEVFDAHALARDGRPAVDAAVSAFLTRTGWTGDEPVLAVKWEETTRSPSTQLWLPPLGEGPPRLNGVYEQLLEGEACVFLGSVCSTLPAPVNEALGAASLTVATALQALGYVGCCSFDFLVTGDVHGDFQVLFTECNGRWGGTSGPMHLVDRLVPGPRPQYLAQHLVHPGLVGARFTDVLAATDDLLFDPHTGKGHFVFYNVGPLKDAGKLDVIAFADTPEQGEEKVRGMLARRLGLT